MTSIVQIDYTNHAGQRAWRRIEPRMLSFTKTNSHAEQWILIAWDLDKEALRGFAMKDIHEWKPAT